MTPRLFTTVGKTSIVLAGVLAISGCYTSLQTRDASGSGSSSYDGQPTKTDGVLLTDAPAPADGTGSTIDVAHGSGGAGGAFAPAGGAIMPADANQGGAGGAPSGGAGGVPSSGAGGVAATGGGGGVMAAGGAGGSPLADTPIASGGTPPADGPSDSQPDVPTVVCNSVEHICNGTCVNNSALATCGPTECVTACQQPTGGSVTCNGTACVQSCPAGAQLCEGACIAQTAPCVGKCTGGQQYCASSNTCIAASACCSSSDCSGSKPYCSGGICVACTSDSQCGTNKVCNSTSNECVCASGTCGSTCQTCSGNTPYCSSNGTCVACTSDDQCGPNKVCSSTTNACACASGTCGSTCQTCSGGTTCQGGTCACPAGTSTCGGSSCVSTNDPTHCGSSCLNCGAGSTCPAGSCLCRQPNAANLVTNPNFDTQTDLQLSWNPTGGSTWINVDADGCPNSGSAQVPGGGVISQCIPASAGHTYYVGATHKDSDAGGLGGCFFAFELPGCAGAINAYDTNGFVGGNFSTWTSGSNSETAPAGTGAIYIECDGAGSSTIFDQFYVNADTLVGF